MPARAADLPQVRRSPGAPVPLRTRGRPPRSPLALAHVSPVHLPDGGRALHVPAAHPSLPTVVLLHGWVMDRTAWAPAAFPLLAAGCGLVLPDLPGHGEAQAPPAHVGPGELFPATARHLLRGLDALGLSRVALGGFSMGATAALHLLALAPRRFERALLLGPVLGAPLAQFARAPLRLQGRLVGNVARAFRGPSGALLRRLSPGLVAHTLPLPHGVQARVAAWLADGRRLPARSTRRLHPPGASRCEVDVFLEGVGRTDARTTLRFLAAAAASHPGPEALARFPGPVVLASGALDALSPAAPLRRLAARAGAARSRAGLPGAAPLLAEVPAADHVALSQAPAAVTALLQAWLAVPPHSALHSTHEVTS
jgi:pimeloyl-ACP methyl ester carboxylesterase